jgi:hypothetical protein
MADPLPIDYPGFEGRGLALRPSGFFTGAAIVCDGRPATRTGRTFSVNDNRGSPVTFQLKGSIFDPLPAVQAGDRLIRFAAPFTWYEYVWIALPLALLVLGGALGGACGAAAAYINARLLRSSQPMWARYGLGVLVILGATLIWVVLAMLITLALR